MILDVKVSAQLIRVLTHAVPPSVHIQPYGDGAGATIWVESPPFPDKPRGTSGKFFKCFGRKQTPARVALLAIALLESVEFLLESQGLTWEGRREDGAHGRLRAKATVQGNQLLLWMQSDTGLRVLQFPPIRID